MTPTASLTSSARGQARGRWLTLLALLPLAGCYSYRTVRVTVCDAETGRPIPGAVVSTAYNQGLAHAAPTSSRGVTGPDGSTRLPVAKDPQGIFITPEAGGYLDYWADGAFPDGRPYARPYTELPPWPFDAVTLTLYAKPAPDVVLVVPDGYRGLVAIDGGYGRRGNPRPGGRRFEVPWEPGRVARLRDLPQMHGSPVTVTHVRYAGGQEIRFGRPRTDGVGWWWTGKDVLIGTWEERRAIRPGLPAAGAADVRMLWP